MVKKYWLKWIRSLKDLSFFWIKQLCKRIIHKSYRAYAVSPMVSAGNVLQQTIKDGRERGKSKWKRGKMFFNLSNFSCK